MKYGFTERERRLYHIKSLQEHENDMMGVGIVIFLGMLLLTAIYFVVPNVGEKAEAQEIEPVVEVNGAVMALGEFCLQAIADHQTLGKPLTGDLLDVCGAYE